LEVVGKPKQTIKQKYDSNLMKIFRTILIGGVCAFALRASANTATFDTSAGSTAGGNPVDAEAVFTTGNGTLSITLRNLQADPTAVIQAISGLSFNLSSGQVSGLLTSSSGMERTINGNGSYTDGAVVSTGWLLGPGLYLNDLAGGAAGPAHTLIGGPGTGGIYHGNNSITGNSPHNPFLEGDLTFNISIAGLTAADTVTGVTFQFGTATGTNVSVGNVPDGGSTMMLLGCAVSGLALFRRKLV
jgi:hypothetical protein